MGSKDGTSIQKIFMNILNEGYPEAFNFEEFNKIRSYSKKLRYANGLLRKISSGSARVVYQVDESMVIKIAKNKKGLAQNLIENDWSLQNTDIVAKIFESSQELTEGIGPFWVEMEFAKKVGPSRFKQLSGFSKDEVQAYLDYLRTIMKPHAGSWGSSRIVTDELKNRAENSEWMQSLTEMIINYDMSYPGDFGRVNSYGEVIRDGKPALVLVDFGLTSTVWNDFYKVELKGY